MTDNEAIVIKMMMTSFNFMFVILLTAEINEVFIYLGIERVDNFSVITWGICSIANFMNISLII